jgi:hypothetical protein
MRIKALNVLFIVLFVVVSTYPMLARAQSAPLPADQVQAIAKDAYVYGFPMVDNYRVLYGFCVDTKSPEFKAPFNQINNEASVFTPADKTVQTPNSDYTLFPCGTRFAKGTHCALVSCD